MTRSSGILLHPASLPSQFGIGSLGKDARDFIDFMAAAGQDVWQILPLGPTGYGDSPYNALSAFAGNPLLVDLDELVSRGDLNVEDLPERDQADRIDYGQVTKNRETVLSLAAERFLQRDPSGPRHSAFAAFCREHAGWLDDYALFMALREQQNRESWLCWPRPLRLRDPAALEQARAEQSRAIRCHQYQQFVFFEQWFAIRSYANQKKLRLLGDIPIFVAFDSADVWAHQELFRLDPDGRPRVVAGVPPDYFSATGQRWGNPLYRWDIMQETGFAWWLERFRWNFRLTDMVRVDHFRGFESCWVIPGGASTAVDGEWEAVPGDALFEQLCAEIPAPPVIAEDLGVITPEVEQLRETFGFPGMKILQFAFDSGPENPYLPHNHLPRSVVYTGTHDNATLCGWWQGRDKAEKDRVRRYLGKPKPELPWDIIRVALSSVAELCILPCQDILGLGNRARLNRPGTATGNWAWRLEPGALQEELAVALKAMCETYGR